jgi:hypothetical protein
MPDTALPRLSPATRLSLSHLTAQNGTNLLGAVPGGVIVALPDSVDQVRQ